MRILILFGLFLSCLFFYRTVEEKVQYAEDTSAISSYVRTHSLKKTLILKAEMPKDEVNTILASKVEENSVLGEPTRELAVEEPTDSEQVEVAWDELNQKWQSELKDYLFSVDPEHAEEVFEAYVKVGKNFRETPEEIHGDEATDKHQEKLKEVFGAHFEAVQGLHQEYVNSLQDETGPDTQLYLQL